MNTDVDTENELLQLVVEELVRAGLRTSLREPILAAVESTSGERVEVVVPERPGDAASTDEIDDGPGEEGTTDAASESAERGPIRRATRGLVAVAVAFTVLYVALRRLTD